MSALTDLFSAMANKIRSKTGTATTYTPSEMVSDGIDDVYDAGVASATTPITPSNSSPASMTANTGYKPTANGYAIASYSSVTPSNAGDLVSSGDIVKFGGSGVVVDDIEGITPSDSNPVTLYMGHYYGMGDDGYAIASYTSVTPSGSQVSVSNGDIVKFGGSGVVVDSINVTNIRPDNANPPALSLNSWVNPQDSGYAIASYDSITPSSGGDLVSSGDIVKIGGSGVLINTNNVYGIEPSNTSPVSLSMGSYYGINETTGYAIKSYTSVTPSSTQTAVSSGDIVKIGGSGVIVDSVPTPTSITPSNSSPVALTANTPVNPTASGYAISSYSLKTPYDANPPSISSGAIIKASSAGYLHKTAQGFTNYPLKIRNTSSSTSLSLTGLTSGKNYLLFVWNWGGSVSYSDTRFDGTTASGATITKIANLRDTGGSNIRVAGTFFLMKTSSTSVTLSNTNQMLALVFMAE